MQFVNWVILAVVGKLLATGNDLGAAGMSVVINPTGRRVIIWGNAQRREEAQGCVFGKVSIAREGRGEGRGQVSGSKWKVVFRGWEGEH